MSHPDKGKGIEGRDLSFGDRLPPNNRSNSAESMHFGQNFDDRFLNGDSYNQRLYHLGSTNLGSTNLGSTILGPAGTMNNTQGPRNGSSGTYVSASHYQARMSGQSHSVHHSASPMPPPMNSRLVANVPNGSNTLYYNPTLLAPGRFSEIGIMMPWASNLGTPNRNPHDLNFSSNIYHDSRNGVGFHNQRSLVPAQDGLPGSFDRTAPIAAHHSIPPNMARSLPFRTQDSPHGRRGMHNPPHGARDNNNRTLQNQAPNPPHGSRSVHYPPGTVLGNINPVQPVAAPNSVHGSRAMHNPPLRALQPYSTGNYRQVNAYSDRMAQAARTGIIGAHQSQIPQAHRGGPAIFPPQQSRAFHSVQQTGPVVSSQRSSAGFLSQNSGVIQSSQQARALPSSGLSHGQVLQNNNYFHSVGSHYSGAPQGQLPRPVNNTHPGAYPFNHFPGRAVNSSRHPGNQVGASQGQVANTSLRPGHQIGAPQLQPAPAVNHVLQAPVPPAGSRIPLEIYFTSLGINSSGPFGQQGGRRSKISQLPRLGEPRSRLRGLRSSPNGLAATTFHNFNNLPIELRLIVWNLTIQRGVPRFIFFGYMNLPPAMAQVNVEARRLYKDDCKYYKLADTQRVTIYAPKQDMFLFKQYIPGLRLAAPGEWSPVPVEMTPSPLPFGLLSVGRFVDTPIPPPDNTSSTWMSGVTSFAVTIRLAFTYFRRGAKSKADQNWKKLANICPDLQEIFLISCQGPSTTTTLNEMTEINEDELDNDRQHNPEQYWASQIIQGHQRNLQSGDTRNFVFTYVVFLR